jgi:hypothetical protein
MTRHGIVRFAVVLLAANPPGEDGGAARAGPQPDSWRTFVSRELDEVSKDRSISQSESEIAGEEARCADRRCGQRARGALRSGLRTELAKRRGSTNLSSNDVQKLGKTTATDWQSMWSKIEDRLASLDAAHRILRFSNPRRSSSGC